MHSLRRGTISLVTLAVALTTVGAPARSAASVLPGGTVNATYAAGSAALVKVQVKGHRYVFIVDTGASNSAVTAKAATALGLVATGAAHRVWTIGCSTSQRFAEMTGWRVGKVALPPTPVGIINNALARDKLGGVSVSGLLGSDVLSQFGTVTFDLAHSHLVLGGRLAHARAGIPMQVVRSHGAVVESIRASINRHPSTYVLDTGSPLTLLQASKASGLGLVSIPGSVEVQGAAGCSLKAHLTEIIQWSAGGQSLPSTPALTVRAPGIKTSAKGSPVGLIGAETLFSFGRLAMDFTHGRLILGSPTVRARPTTGLSPLLSRYH